LRDEFEKKCVYCRMPDTMKDAEMYGVDHYRPKSLFPELASEYSNLFYCCNPCNRRKSDYWPTRSKLKTHFIPNPCDHEMHTHLRFAGERVEPRTAAGDVAHELLDLDDPEVVAYRWFIHEDLRLFEALRADARETLAALRRLKTSPTPAFDVRADIAALEEELANIERHLARLEGR
jgi:uncharacterized protein (TIGR02646 family)